MDRFYATIDTIQCLTDAGFGVYGAVMKNRARLSEDIKNQPKDLRKGESLFYCPSNKDILFTIWRDSKILHLVSNIKDNKTSEIFRRQEVKDSNTGLKTIIKSAQSCPNNVKNYSKFSRGVDYLDQMISYYSNEIMSNNWYTSIFLHLIEIAMPHRFILYQNSQGKNLKYSEYRKSVVESLVSDMKSKKDAERFRSAMIIESSEEPCQLQYNFKTYCEVCKGNGFKKYTSYFCGTHKIPVCILSCYDLHRKVCN